MSGTERLGAGAVDSAGMEDSAEKGGGPGVRLGSCLEVRFRPKKLNALNGLERKAGADLGVCKIATI